MTSSASLPIASTTVQARIVRRCIAAGLTRAQASEFAAQLLSCLHDPELDLRPVAVDMMVRRVARPPSDIERWALGVVAIDALATGVVEEVRRAG